MKSLRSAAALLAVIPCLIAPAAQDIPLEPGLTLRVYDIGRPLQQLAPLQPDQTPNVDRRIDVLDLRDDAAFGGPSDYFFVEAEAFLRIETAGTYAFALTSDDGARLTIDGETVVEHDGLHAATERQGDVELTAGQHDLRVVMFENQGGSALSLSWRPPGAAEFTLVPAKAFAVEKGITRVVSPGTKTLLDGREHLRPGDGMPLDGVHPGWRVESVRPADFEPKVGGLDFLIDGRIAITTFDPVNNGIFREEPNGTLWALDGTVPIRPTNIEVTKIADGFHDPSGLVVVNGDVYVSHRTGIERLRDLDDDGVYEVREVFAEPWVSDNYHHFSFGLEHYDGWIYGSLSTSIYFGNTIEADGVEGEVVSMNGPNPPNRGTCYRINIDTREVEFLAGGFRTPNGILVTEAGDVFVADNQGAWLPSSKLIHVKPGRFYGHANGEQTSERYPDGGHPSLFVDEPVSPPAVWLPQNEAANSPSTPVVIPYGPFEGQLLLGELTLGGIRRIVLEEVGGELQGVVFRFTQGLECGVNRLQWGPDDCLYVGGTGAGGNWNWRGTQFGLQRLRPISGGAFEYHTVRATEDGFEIELTRPVNNEWLADPANYKITHWRYEATPQYGGPKHDVTVLPVAEALPGPDGKSVRLVIPGLLAGYVVHLRMDPTDLHGNEMWSTEAWYTLNQIPALLE